SAARRSSCRRASRVSAGGSSRSSRRSRSRERALGAEYAEVTNGQRRRPMPEHTTATREEWQAARDELAKLEAEHAELGQKVTEQRRGLPWVRVDKEYAFDTENGSKRLAELFDGRSQLLAYNIMFGPDYELGAW